MPPRSLPTQTAALLCLILSLGACAGSEAPPAGPEAGTSPRDAGLAPTVEEIASRAQPAIIEGVSPERIRNTLKRLAAPPHLAGTPLDLRIAEQVHKEMLAAGLEARLDTYEVLLTTPEEVTVEMLAPQAYGVDYQPEVTDLDFDTHTRTAVPPYLAYSPDGEVTGRLVYVNQARAEDFALLRSRGLLLKGAVGIARRGALPAGSQVRNAERAGLSALLLYADPLDDGFLRGDAYPDGPWRPQSAVTRDALLDLAVATGDPLTPDSVSIRDAKRKSYDEIATLPVIPAAPLSSREALPLMRSLRGGNVPAGWQGGLPFTYHVGGGDDAVVRVSIRSSWRIKKIWNVVGVLRGFPHPEEQVVIGAPRDTWVHGVGESGSATATLLETARVLGDLARKGFRPSRTLVFASWDASRFGAIGSTEHVQKEGDGLRNRTVLYVECGPCTGDRLEVQHAPELEALVRGALASSPDERRSRRSLLGLAAVQAGPPAGIGDHLPFAAHAGVPVVAVASHGQRGVVGTRFDTYRWMERFGDPDFARHSRLTRLVAALVYRAGVATVLPHDHRYLVAWTRRQLAALRAERPGLDFTALNESLDRTQETAGALDALRREALKLDPDPDRLQLANRRLIRTASPFVTPVGPAERPFYRSLLFAPDPADAGRPLPLPRVRLAENRGTAQVAIDDLAAAFSALADELQGLADALRFLVDQDS